jgi:hypothetical protein
LNDEDEAILIIKGTHYTLLSRPPYKKGVVRLVAR